MYVLYVYILHNYYHIIHLQDIKVGVHYQATIPVCRQSTALPTSYQTTPTGELKWRPRETSDKTGEYHIIASLALSLAQCSPSIRVQCTGIDDCVYIL